MAYNRNIDLLRLISDPTADDEILAVDRRSGDGEQVRVKFGDILGRTLNLMSRRTLIIAGRGWLAESLGGGAGDANNTNADSRIAVRNGPFESSNVRLVFGNFYADTVADLDGPNPITVRAAVEVQSSVDGTYLTIPVTFNGSLSVVIDPKAGIVISDPVGLTLNPNQLFAVRCNCQVTSGQQFPVGNLNMGTASLPQFGDVFGMAGVMVRNTGATVVYNTGLPAGTATIGFSHLAVLGETTAAMPSIVVFGDSISKASGDNQVTNINAGESMGFIGRGLKLSNGVMLPNTIMGRNGAGLQTWGSAFNGADIHRRLALLDYATWALCEFGTNDIMGAPALSQMQAWYRTAWGHAKKRGCKVAQTLIMPRTSGTYTSAAGQSYINASFAPGALRDQVNAWIRSQVGGGLLDAVIDPNPYVEDPAAPGKWLSTGGVALTADGVHPNAAGHLEAAKAVRAWADTLV